MPRQRRQVDPGPLGLAQRAVHRGHSLLQPPHCLAEGRPVVGVGEGGGAGAGGCVAGPVSSSGVGRVERSGVASHQQCLDDAVDLPPTQLPLAHSVQGSHVCAELPQLVEGLGVGEPRVVTGHPSGLHLEVVQDDDIQVQLRLYVVPV